MIWTIGHSTHTVAELASLLGQASIDLLADVRSVPRSRTNPQFNADTLPGPLAAAGIVYRHLPALGGLRSRRKDGTPSSNTFWRNQAFRNYADYAATAAFRAGLDELTSLGRDHRCAIMCAEALWWRCHRRIIADYLLFAGIAVGHIMGPGKIDPAMPTPAAHRGGDGTLVYPAAEQGAPPSIA
jgi:uncharacterized protein (DUF488 family)